MDRQCRAQYWSCSKGKPIVLEHRVAAGSALRHGLGHIPVFDDFAVFQFENIDDGVATRARLAYGVDVQDDEVTIDKTFYDGAVRGSPK